MTVQINGTTGITIPGLTNTGNQSVAGNETVAGSLTVSGGAYVPEATLTDGATISWTANTQQDKHRQNSG